MTLITSNRNGRLLDLALAELKVVSGPDSQGEHVCWCPFHPDGEGKPPHQPNLYVSQRGFKCHACGASGSLYKLCRELELPIPPDLTFPDQDYSYTDAYGQLLYQVVRSPGKKFRQRRPDGSGGWIWNMQGVERVLYRLQDLRSSPKATVFIVEGEKDADRLAEEGLTATTNSGGAGKWRQSYNPEFKDRDVIILPDNDDVGRKHAEKVAGYLDGVAVSVKVLELPGLEEKGDISDWLDAGHTTAELMDLAKSSRSIALLKAQNHQPPPMQSAVGGSQADRLVQLALGSGIELFHDPLNEPYARIPVMKHSEILRINGDSFKNWLQQLLWEAERKAPSPEPVRSAIGVLTAIARFESPEYQLHNRVAITDGEIWVDLSDSERRAVRISSKGWEIEPSPPILFKSYSHQRPMVNPEAGGDLHSVLSFVNIKDKGQQLLLLVHLVSCFIPDIAHPIYLPYGPQGSGKSSFLRIARDIVDPSTSSLLRLENNVKQLGQQLSHQWAPMYDNISRISDEVSDFLCRAVTGVSESTRKLYTDDEDVFRSYRRCIGLNGINIVAQKPDLLDRSILYSLKAIEQKDRITDEVLRKGFETIKPKLVGAILTALSKAMELYPSLQDGPLPRMADFALWGCAIAEALGHTKEEFLEAYDRNRATQHLEALLSDPVGEALLSFMEHRPFWKGSPTELYRLLDDIAREQGIWTSSRDWPKAPHALSRKLNNLAMTLRALGFNVEVGGRTTANRYVLIQRESATNPVYHSNGLASLDTIEVITEANQESFNEDKDSCEIPDDSHTNPETTQVSQMTLFSDFEGKKHRDPS